MVLDQPEEKTLRDPDSTEKAGHNVPVILATMGSINRRIMVQAGLDKK
jgi:hypothetical protein